MLVALISSCNLYWLTRIFRHCVEQARAIVRLVYRFQTNRMSMSLYVVLLYSMLVFFFKTKYFLHFWCVNHLVFFIMTACWLTVPHARIHTHRAQVACNKCPWQISHITIDMNAHKNTCDRHINNKYMSRRTVVVVSKYACVWCVPPANQPIA